MATQEKKGKSLFDNDPIDYYKFLLSVWNHRKFILSVTAVIVLLSIIISFIITPVYRAHTTILPVTSKTNIDGAMSGIISMPVLSVSGVTDDSRRIMIMLDSKTIKKNLIQKHEKLRNYFKFNEKDNNSLNDAVYSLNGMTDVILSKETGLITLSVENSDPALATDIANFYIEELQILLNENSMYISKIKMKIIEQQLRETEEQYKKQQDELVQFQKKTKMMKPVLEGRGTMDLYTDLISKKAALEVQLKSIEAALTPESPQVRSLKSQIGVINGRIMSIENASNIGELPSLKDAPDKLAQYTNLAREVQISETIYNTLLKLYEQTKLEMTRDFLFIQVIDMADVPRDRINFTRRHIVFYAGFGSFLAGIFLVLMAEWLSKFNIFILDIKWLRQAISKIHF